MSRTAILFPGQGAQYVGMAKNLAASSRIAKDLFDEASTQLGYDLLAVCSEGPAERLNATNVSQPAIFVASLAALQQWKSAEPDALAGVEATAGLSLGEYTSLVFAGSMSFADGLRVVHARGQAMQTAAEATPGAMASLLGAELADVEQLVQDCRGSATLEIANYLCPGNTVVSGELRAVEAVYRAAEARGFKPIRLTVAGAFHTQLMKPADQHLAEALSRVTLHPPRLPIWSNVDARPHTHPEELRELLVRQIVSPVRWEATMQGMLAAGIERFVEVGPGRVLAGLLKRIHRKAEIHNIPA